jgi:hypothetical protein
MVTDIMSVVEGIDQYEGNTLKQKAEAFLLECGVTQAQIESIRNIFLGE